MFTRRKDLEIEWRSRIRDSKKHAPDADAVGRAICLRAAQHVLRSINHMHDLQPVNSTVRGRLQAVDVLLNASRRRP